MSRYAKEVNKCLVKIRAGDKSAMATLFDTTANHLLGVIKCYLVNPANSEDVLLQTYERALLYVNSFNPKQDGYNWLCGIARNLAFSYNAKEAKTCGTTAENPENTPIDWTENLETKIDLLQAISNFDETDKKIVFWRFYLQESLSEIAQKLGVSKVAVHKRLQKICKTLKEKL